MTIIDETKNIDRIAAEKNLRAVKTQARVLTDAQVCVDFGEFSLLLPSKEIVSLMSIQQLHTTLKSDLASDLESELVCGTIDVDQQTVPVFCFNKALQLQTLLTDKHTAILLLEHQDSRFAISGCEIIKVNEASLSLYKVPLCMSSRKQPFTEFAIINNRAAGISSTAALLKLLRLRGVKTFAVDNTANTLLQTPTSFLRGVN